MYESPLDRNYTRFKFATDAILHSYSVFWFSQKRWIGMLLLACSMLFPTHGVLGLAGLVVSLLVAVRLEFDRDSIRNGRFLFNSLLVSLTVACNR